MKRLMRATWAKAILSPAATCARLLSIAIRITILPPQASLLEGKGERGGGGYRGITLLCTNEGEMGRSLETMDTSREGRGSNYDVK